MVDSGPRDAGWRRGDTAAWWDGAARVWRAGTLVARVPVPCYEYDVSLPDGALVRVPERSLRSPDDPAVRLEPPPTRPPAPPRRPGATLSERAPRA